MRSFCKDRKTDWWLSPTPLKTYEFVNWDDYSQYMEEKKMLQTTNQKSDFVRVRQDQIVRIRRRISDAFHDVSSAGNQTRGQ